VLTDRELVQRVAVTLEALVLLHVRGPDEAAVQVVGPPVVRARERLPGVAPRVVVEELRPPVRAHVVEAVQLPGRVPHEEHRFAGEVLHDEVAGARDLL